jgi:hypothetical protein
VENTIQDIKKQGLCKRFLSLQYEEYVSEKRALFKVDKITGFNPKSRIMHVI